MSAAAVRLATKAMVSVVIVLVTVAVVNHLWPSKPSHAVPISSIAPEVCQGNGRPTSAERAGKLLYVTCSDRFDSPPAAMKGYRKYRVTTQTARIVERTYEVNVPAEILEQDVSDYIGVIRLDDPQDATWVHEETMVTHTEVTGMEPVQNGE